ncbi:MAG: aminotransferase class I/II-fold pyridoxal phosphate-dependent enzyme [Ruminococcus sp.]|nr:aminotransferase class I/II-fold pyridoxal phosphate-dependent enzyme [Ruminococcus sp.]
MIQQHGGNIYDHGAIIDFSANINPLGMPEGVRRALLGGLDEIERYPDPYCRGLTESIAAYEEINAESIVCGNGADDLIFRIVHALRPRRALICAPAFGEYGRALSEAGCAVYEHILTEDNGFELTEDILGRLDEDMDICFLCTPNNPTGRLISPGLLRRIAEKCREKGIMLVCDECFLGFVRNGESFSLREHMNGNCIILKAFTKLYAIPGLRLGYALCGDVGTAELIKRSGQFWSVSAPAQTAGRAALEDKGYVKRTVEYIGSQRGELLCGLASAGVKVFEGAANFLLIKSADGLAEKMLEEGILIRDCRSFSGLEKGFYRIAVRRREENRILLEALRRCLNG